MFFLNLTAGEFLTLLGASGGLITALYLLDRSRRKKTVSTLRFWNPALASQREQSRKRVREPWSLVLQLASLLLLLLAIAQLQWGTRGARGYDHVLLLDTSAWSAQQSSEMTVLAREKAEARQLIAALLAGDRIMLVRVDALSTPVTPFTSDHQVLDQAIAELTSTFSALNIDQALSFAHQARAWSGGQEGEVVYVGPRFIQEESAAFKLNGLRVMSVPASRENSGIRRIAVTRGQDEANSWVATVTLKNYGLRRRDVRLHADFAGTVFAPRAFTLAAGQETAAQYDFVTNVSGRFTVAMEPHDALPADDQASLELPGSGLLRIAAFTRRPDVLRPLLEANHHVFVKFLSPATYDARPAADLVLLDQFAPASPSGAQPRLPSLWIDPPSEGSPLPVKAVVNDALIKTWHSDAGAGVGLHAKEAQIRRAKVFQTFEGDQPIGSIAEGPVVVVRRANGSQLATAVVGFDPLSGPMRFEVTTPLLFANLLRWLSPEALRNVEIIAGRVGAASVILEATERVAHVHVIDEAGMEVPFTIRGGTLQLFATRPSIVRVISEGSERLLSLTLPDIAEFEWKPLPSAMTGLPLPRSFLSTSTDLWRWLAILGGLGLLTEWLLFGRSRLLTWRSPGAGPKVSPVRERERELVSK